MTNLAALLHEAADSIDVESGAELAAADLHRGRRAASRRRIRRFATRGAGIAAIAAVAVTVGVNQSGGGPRPVRLVAYTGQQSPGFTVDQVPAGWTVQGSTGVGTQYPAVTIAPIDDPDTDPSHVDGKLVVQGGVYGAIPGSHHVGHIVASNQNSDGSDSSVSIAVRQDPNGALTVLDVPSSLDWSRTQASAFAEGVHVTD